MIKPMLKIKRFKGIYFYRLIDPRFIDSVELWYANLCIGKKPIHILSLEMVKKLWLRELN